MIDEFNQINFSDAEIFRMHTKKGDLHIELKDWQEKEISLVFKEVIGFEAFSPEGEDLSHGIATQKDPFIEHACKIANDNQEGVICFRFWSSWSNQPILTIAARDFEISSI